MLRRKTNTQHPVRDIFTAGCFFLGPRNQIFPKENTKPKVGQSVADSPTQSVAEKRAKEDDKLEYDCQR